MTEFNPIHLIGSSPNFTGIGELMTGDTIAGLLNTSELSANTLFVKDTTDTLQVLTVPTNYVVGNIGLGLTAFPITALGIGAGPSSISTLIIDTDGDTYVDAEQMSDEDILRIACAGISVAIINSTDGIELLSDSLGVVLLSPNGTRYKLLVTDTGALSTTAI